MAILEAELNLETKPAIETELSTRKALPDLRDMTLDIGDIASADNNPRDLFDAEKLESLADSIARHGLLQPVVVRRNDPYIPGQPAYTLIAGERRLRACKMAGVLRVRAILRYGIADDEALALTLIENLQREELSPIETAKGYSQLMDMGYSQERIVRECGGSVPDVSNKIGLLKLPPSVQDLISEGKLSFSHGKVLRPFIDRVRLDEGVELAEEAAAEGWSIKRLESVIDLRFPKLAPPQTLLDVPADSLPKRPEEQSRFAPPGPAPAGESLLVGGVLPLTPGGDSAASEPAMTDEEWEASANPPSPKPAADALAELNTERDEMVAGWKTGESTDDNTQTDDAQSAGEPPDISGAAEVQTDLPLPATDGQTETPAALVAAPQPGSTPAADNPAKASPPVAAKPAPTPAAKPTPPAPTTAQAPAAPALPAGFTTAIVKIEDFAKAQEMGLWPLALAIEALTEAQAAASTPPAEITRAEAAPMSAPPSTAMTVAGVAATRLAEINATAGSILYAAETQLLDEMFPERETTGADHIVAVLVTARLREMNVKEATE